ncbi:hypothetical protein U1Q18_005630 [Sarracenia purpurea var. burkii]
MINPYWFLGRMTDQLESARHIYEYSFSEHTLRVTDVAAGYGGCNAIVVSASEDRTCKVWSLSKGKLLRNIVFPSIIDAIALEPGEHVFYAGGRDGKIYIAALNAQGTSSNSYGMHIIGSLADHSKAVTCLTFAADGVLLVSGYEDGMVRVWNTKTHNIVRIFKHAKGPVNNIIVARWPLCLNRRMLLNSQSASVRRHGSSLPPPLEKYSSLTDEIVDVKAYLSAEADFDEPLDALYISIHTMNNQIKELQSSTNLSEEWVDGSDAWAEDLVDGGDALTKKQLTLVAMVQRPAVNDAGGRLGKKKMTGSGEVIFLYQKSEIGIRLMRFEWLTMRVDEP